LSINLTFTTFYFHHHLNKNDIFCTLDDKLNAAGKVNIVVFDKTGTLTDEGLEIEGYQTTRLLEDDSYIFDDLEKTAKVYKAAHRAFWKRHLNHYLINQNSLNIIDKVKESIDEYNTNLSNNVFFFYECLALCNMMNKIHDDLFGNVIDRIVFDDTRWSIYKKWNIEENKVIYYNNHINNINNFNISI